MHYSGQNTASRAVTKETTLPRIADTFLQETNEILSPKIAYVWVDHLLEIIECHATLKTSRQGLFLG